MTTSTTRKIGADVQPHVPATAARSPVAVAATSRYFGMRSPSLKLRLCFLISALISLLTIAGGAYIVQRAQRDIQGEVRSAVTLAAHYLDAQIAVAALRPHADGWSSVLLHLADLRELRHVRVVYYDRAGDAIDASESGETDEDKSPPWFEWIVRRTLPPLADYRRELEFDGDDVGHVVVKPDPSDEIAEIWNVSRGLLRLLLVFVLVVNGLVWWAVGRALQPVRRISEALGELGNGNLAARMSSLELAELAGLSDDFNRMAQRLQSSVAENQILTRRLIATQDDERKRIARELHDEIGQCVTAIHADAVAIQQSPDARTASVQASASAIVNVTSSIKEMVRGMLQRLRPAALEGLALNESLRHLVAAFQQRNDTWLCALNVSRNINGCDADTSMAVYRLVQEALTNVARHASARVVSVDAAVTRRTGAHSTASLIRVCIADDGVGFAAARVSGRFGLLGMRERIHGLDGVLRVTSAPGEGTRIVAELPLSDH